MRARMAIATSGQTCALREVVLRNKPEELTLISPKGTVPVLVLPNEKKIEESLEIMHWALEINDPEKWLRPFNTNPNDINLLISENDGPFKENLDRFKYPTRYELSDPIYHRNKGLLFLQKLDTRLSKNLFLYGQNFTFADAAVSPFIRQFANIDFEWFDSLDLYGVKRWLKSILESDYFLSVMEKYPAWKKGMEEPVFPSN